MATLDTLPGDQRAVLTLVLGRGRSYDEIAGLLSIDTDAVSGRARAALEALVPPPAAGADADRQLLCDYLLGQASRFHADAARGALGRSPVERAWARTVADAIAPLASHPLPDIPSEPVRWPSAPSPPAPGAAAPVVETPETPEPEWASEPEPEPEPAPEPAAAEPPPGPPPEPATTTEPLSPGPKRSSRLGGAAVIVVIVVVIVAALVLATRHHHHAARTADRGTVTTTNSATSTIASSTTASTSAGSARPIAQINLSPTASGSRATAIAEVLQQGTQREVAIIGQDVPANTAHDSYEVWLYNSQGDAASLGFVSPGVGSSGRLSTAGPLPSDAGRYRRLVITTETVAKPKAPGPILLSGTISGL